MLVLSRKRNEKFIIETTQGTATIHVLAFSCIRGVARVKLGIDVPKEMPIHRVDERKEPPKEAPQEQPNG